MRFATTGTIAIGTRSRRRLVMSARVSLWGSDGDVISVWKLLFPRIACSASLALATVVTRICGATCVSWRSVDWSPAGAAPVRLQHVHRRPALPLIAVEELSQFIAHCNTAAVTVTMAPDDAVSASGRTGRSWSGCAEDISWYTLGARTERIAGSSTNSFKGFSNAISGVVSEAAVLEARHARTHDATDITSVLSGVTSRMATVDPGRAVSPTRTARRRATGR